MSKLPSWLLTIIKNEIPDGDQLEEVRDQCAAKPDMVPALQSFAESEELTLEQRAALSVIGGDIAVRNPDSEHAEGALELLLQFLFEFAATPDPLDQDDEVRYAAASAFALIRDQDPDEIDRYLDDDDELLGALRWFGKQASD